MAGGVGPIRSSGTLMAIFQVQNGCITELHRRGDIMCDFGMSHQWDFIILHW